MEKQFRTNLINSLSGFKSVVLLGSKNTEGVENLSVISSVIHIGANPALMGFVMRPVTTQRDTYKNILAIGDFTFNHIQPSFVEKAHQCAARYDASISEFEAVGLTPFYSERMNAPFVKESQVRIGLSLEQVIPIPLNQTSLIIGAVKEIYCPESVVLPDGNIDIEAAWSITVSGLDTYHKTEKIARFSYAKPDRQLTQIS